MKWDQLILMFVFMSLFFLIVTTLIFYIKHWSSRRLSTVNSSSIEGEYFKRYIPENLRVEYDRIKSSGGKRTGILRRFFAKLATLVVLMAAIGISLFSFQQNIDTLLIPIDLSPEEIKNLDYTQHQWRREIDNRLPQLEQLLSRLPSRGFIVPYSENDKNWLFNGKNIRNAAYQQWVNFAEKHHFETIGCRWDLLQQCLNNHKSWIILVLPGFWDLASMDYALKRGANVIAYGPPAQIDSQQSGLEWQGIKFTKVVSEESGSIILRGDQLLTLNFDAGLILDASSSFKGFQAYADNSQAVTFDASYQLEKTKGTRLYAKTIGQGRLVWLDFAPDAVDHSLDINVTHLNAIIASIFRYFSRQSYSAIATWPEGRDYAALVDEDTEDQFSNADKVAKLARKYDFPISWYILSNEALKNRSLTRELSETGEIACHGDHHGVFTLSTKQDQVVRIARCKKVLKALTDIEPKAFRPPEERFNTATIDAIANNGMDHYIAVNSPDRAVPEIMSSSDGKSLVSIPRMINDDYELWHKRNLNYGESVSLFKGEVEWSQFIGGIHMFSFHTQYIKDPNHYQALEYLCEKLKKSGAYFETSSSIAKWWRVHEKLSNGLNVSASLVAKYHPVVLTVTKNGELSVSSYKINSTRI